MSETFLAAISYDPIVKIVLGPFSVSPHGIGIAVGFLLGARLMLPAAKARGISEDVVFPILTRALIGAILGARIAYVANHFSEYTDDPLDALRLWEGGISLLGGFFGAVILAMPKMRSERLSFWKVMDAAAPGMALGVIIGRIGDLIVADHLGTPTDLPFGYECPPATVETASPCIPGQVVHQTALYNLVLTTALLGLLLWLRRKPRYDGFLILVFSAWYGAGRMVEDFLREDLRRLGLTGSQLTALATMLVSLYVLLVVRGTPRWGRWDELPGGPTDAAADDPDAPEREEPTEDPPTIDAARPEPAPAEEQTP